MNHIPFNRPAFREARDKFVTDAIIDRRKDARRNALIRLREARKLRKVFRKMPKGHNREVMEADYDRLMREWAYFESLRGNIERDSRYIAHMAKQAKGEG